MDKTIQLLLTIQLLQWCTIQFCMAAALLNGSGTQNSYGFLTPPIILGLVGLEGCDSALDGTVKGLVQGWSN